MLSGKVCFQFTCFASNDHVSQQWNEVVAIILEYNNSPNATRIVAFQTWPGTLPKCFIVNGNYHLTLVKMHLLKFSTFSQLSSMCLIYIVCSFQACWTPSWVKFYFKWWSMWFKIRWNILLNEQPHDTSLVQLCDQIYHVYQIVNDMWVCYLYFSETKKPLHFSNITYMTKLINQ